MKHPALLYFDKTREQSFPLALIIGREPNSKMEMGTHAGTYDWREYPRAGLWNMSYSLMAEAVHMRGYELKRICLRCNGSPILIGNALPHGVESKVLNKKPQRMAVQYRASQHINTIFSFADLISRVELVVMSGFIRRAVCCLSRNHRRAMSQQRPASCYGAVLLRAEQG